MTDRIRLHYLMHVELADAEALAEKILIEQSVETPLDVLSDDIKEKILGRIELLEELSDRAGYCRVVFSFSAANVGESFNQLLNLCFGNVSMYPGVRLLDIELPESVLSHFQGPRFGIQGVRQALGVYQRPLLATALKPKGESDAYFADLAYAFASGGGDIIKDDQNLIANFSAFQSRTTACQQALQRAADDSASRCLYFPYIASKYEELERHFAWLKELGLKGVLLSPLIMGLDHARGLAQQYDLIYMAHPAFSGSFSIQASHGMSAELLYGYLYRLAGVDISVFPNAGGRFSFSQLETAAISQRLRAPLTGIAAALPCPAGGMTYADLPDMGLTYGADSVFLLGGSLLQHNADSKKSTADFKAKILEQFDEELVAQEKSVKAVSSCEIGDSAAQAFLEYLPAVDFDWQDRPAILYKKDQTLPFSGVKRVELIGKQDEACCFDLRYFEIEAGGYSSLERHQHSHIIIGARGRGKVLVAEENYYLSAHDVIYIKPNTAHQIHNHEDKPLGFYCIVDRNRDQAESI
jgi:ribulose-bisphosphate carboxylase large chain|tara:strand:+ start:15293 stop:16867 length:1575 start_codon:yes stop_codon:yes gene_type:complete